MQAYKGLDAATNTWTPVSVNDYAEAVSYDPNGNIETYNKKGAPSAGMQTNMDDLGYEYYSNTNKLKRVSDNVAYSGYYSDDIDHQYNANNYTYDAIGNLIADAEESITGISWTVYGKIRTIMTMMLRVTASVSKPAN